MCAMTKSAARVTVSAAANARPRERRPALDHRVRAAA
ncbi:hypothetical protein SAMN04489713_109236 [Actinomadura madurae]|uniref:Uncharacterized protein n=1 Tax=Actinomadura madurae TaxID=1993 RepID=A0A1I5JX82_9ACTN|nr:hypothetical protein SAMN04489713_109236 [Actinomadura madurae]SPT64322.1 Uncharacterised protein [Actinomadura madurae]